MFEKIATFFVGIATFISSIFYPPHAGEIQRIIDSPEVSISREVKFSEVATSEDTFGAVVQLVGGTTYYLSGSGAASSDTSITLSSFTIPQSSYEIADSDLSNVFYLTLEPGNRTRQEFVSCTTVAQSGSDTTATLSGCVRGLSPISPYTASTTLRFAHAGGTSVILSNPPQIYEQFATRENDQIITGLWGFNLIPYATTTATSSSQFATRAYADALSITGAPTSTETTSGISAISTNAQIAAGTASTSTGMPRTIPNRVATSTPGVYSEGWIPATGTDGKIHSRFIATSSEMTWTASTTFSGSPVVFTGATTTFYSATTTFATTTPSSSNMYPVVAIGTSTPGGLSRGGLIVGTSTYIAGGLGVGVATTSRNNVQVQGDVQITGNLSVGGTLTGSKGLFSAVSIEQTSVDRYAIWNATSSSATALQVPVPVAGVIKTLYARVNASNGGALGENVLVEINGTFSSSTPVCTFTNGNGVKTCSDTTKSVSVAAGDYITFLFDTGDTSSETSMFSATVLYQ